MQCRWIYKESIRWLYLGYVRVYVISKDESGKTKIVIYFFYTESKCSENGKYNLNVIITTFSG